MSDVDTSMTREEKRGSVGPEMKQQKDEGQNRKRKRGASNFENPISREDGGIASNSTIETERVGGDVVQTMTPVSNGSIGSSSPAAKPLQGEKRMNPFALPSAPSLKATENSLNLTPPLSSPQVSTSTPSPTKKVIQFQDDDSDDSGQFLHPAKRKVSTEKLSSPRLSQNSKVVLASPKKIPPKVLLLRRKQELEEERKKLPIWSGKVSELLIN
jgi:hypothetical protein